ncbi:ADP-ribosyltransferase [Bacillus toyonensis]
MHNLKSNYIQEHPEEVQDVFARIFSYYMEPHSMEALKLYAADAFKYMETIEWTNLKTDISPLDFRDSFNEARKWGEDNYSDWKEQLSVVEKQAVESYTGAKYDPINQYLRENKGVLEEKNKLNKIITDIDSALKKGPTTRSITVYKRVSEGVFNREYGELRSLTAPYSINDKAFQEIKTEFTNKEFTGYGFESTSLAKDPSKSYSNDRYPILYKITVPQGIQGAFIEPISKYNDQLEFLIARGYTYKMNNFSIVSTNDKPYIQVEISIVPKTQ